MNIIDKKKIIPALATMDKVVIERKILHYQKDIDFNLNNQKIIFYSRFKFINVFLKICGFIFNASVSIQEFYEGSMGKFFPAHEISFEPEKR